MVTLTQMIPYDLGKKTPLLVEVPVDRELAPYLVSSSKSALWIERPHPNNCVRAAVTNHQGHAKSLIEHIAIKGDAEEWGNCHPLSEKGVREALAHLQYYGFGDVEVLFSPSTRDVGIPEGVPVREAPWVPKGWAVVVPVDRSFVGTTLCFKEGLFATVVHNAARGVAVLIGDPE